MQGPRAACRPGPALGQSPTDFLGLAGLCRPGPQAHARSATLPPKALAALLGAGKSPLVSGVRVESHKPQAPRMEKSRDADEDSV